LAIFLKGGKIPQKCRKKNAESRGKVLLGENTREVEVSVLGRKGCNLGRDVAHVGKNSGAQP